MSLSESIIVEDTALSEKLQGLDPREISQAEIHELLVLEKRQQESSQAFLKEMKAWVALDPALRGPKPTWEKTSQSERLRELQSKVQIASIRKRYANIDPRFLSKADAEETIALEQEQTRLKYEHQKMFADWAKQDPATRGPQPEMKLALYKERNNRLQVLRSKVRGAHQVQREINRIKNLSKTHNISILDNEMSELIYLHTEQQKFEAEMNNAIVNALTSQSGQLNAEMLSGGELSGELIDKLPRHLLENMFELGRRLETIQAPFEAAEKADIIRMQMLELSETSGIAISSGEIAETIALNAEKNRIQKRTQLEAGRKWMVEGGPASAAQKSLPNTADRARLEQIEARLEKISTPLMETQ